jgi:membrane protease YdiL (CAAX protease family)
MMDTPNSSEKEKELVWIQILYLYVAPTLLLYFGIIPGQLRIILLLFVALLLLGIVRHAHWTHTDVGIIPNFMKDAVPYTLFTAAGVIFTVWLGHIYPHASFPDWWEDAKFLILFIPISVLQEIVFRGVLMNLLRRTFSSPIFIITINAIVFALIHVIYLHSTFVLPFTFIAGIGFAWMYWQYPNLVLISVSHTILNFVAMILGFFVIR